MRLPHNEPPVSRVALKEELRPICDRGGALWLKVRGSMAQRLVTADHCSKLQYLAPPILRRLRVEEKKYPLGSNTLLP